VAVGKLCLACDYSFASAKLAQAFVFMLAKSLRWRCLLASVNSAATSERPAFGPCQWDLRGQSPPPCRLLGPARVVGNLPDDGLGLLLPPVALSRSVGS